jgi:hypothetical protein
LRTIHDGVEWAKAQGIEYTYWGTRAAFHGLGLEKKVPRQKAPQASAEEREAWEKGERVTEELEESGSKDIAGLYGCDGMQMGLISQG